MKPPKLSFDPMAAILQAKKVGRPVHPNEPDMEWSVVQVWANSYLRLSSRVKCIGCFIIQP